MFRSAIIITICFLYSIHTFAQQDTLQQRMGSGLRISLLTCGTGERVWETFGHSAIRITDSINGTDNVYNYGTFHFGDDFLPQFVRGKLLYYVSYYPYSIFVQEYSADNRSIEEQVLQIGDNDKEEIFAALRFNALDENKYYKYDFYFDNCATRIRDIIRDALGNGFMYGNALPGDGKISFRDISNQYFNKKGSHWERFGVNLLLGSPVDAYMTNDEIMFLPDFVRDALAGARNNGELVAPTSQIVLKGAPTQSGGINWPFLLTLSIAVLTILGLSIHKLKLLGSIMTFLLLFVSGLLGVIMLFMWFGTDHQACQYNYNILWALPTNLILAIAAKKGKGKYAFIAIILMLVNIVLHILKIQQQAMFEMAPLLLSLLFVYGSIIRKSKNLHAASKTYKY